ncbi:30S ribosomal protein S11 [Thalictrum thalictroides]|uniref:30S ribosomal protein S11 n=1 Tax=Thalictrum thalictroides TaxID=46969 RepID=A0A7J6V364_THATH|nr:30S ribosomal protein S11 [Thalictrum thalictroides]
MASVLLRSRRPLSSFYSVVMRSCATSATQQGSGNWKTNFMSTQNRPLMSGSTRYPNANVADPALAFNSRESPKGVVDNHGWDDVEKLKDELRGQRGFIDRSINSIHPPEKQNKKDYVVHFRSIRNNAFVTVTDAKGNKKIGASAGSLEEFKGGARLSRYAAQACAEHVGRISRNLGMTSVVMKVKGFTFFGKKKRTILSWREGYTSGFGGADLPRIVSIRDVTQLPHNGCRLPKKRRI